MDALGSSRDVSITYRNVVIPKINVTSVAAEVKIRTYVVLKSALITQGKLTPMDFEALVGCQNTHGELKFEASLGKKVAHCNSTYCVHVLVSHFRCSS